LVKSEEFELKIDSILPKIHLDILDNYVIPIIEGIEVDQRKDLERYDFVKNCFWALSNILGSKIFAE
jgi:hypothetical protein